MDTKSYLLEIFTEELPALPFLKELPNIATKWQKSAKNFQLDSSVEVFFTPLRIVLYDKNFPLKSKDKIIESYGPPISIAFENGDKNSKLTRAGESFYKKLGLPLDLPLQTTYKDNKEVLYFKQESSGVPSVELLPSVIKDFLDSLQFDKTMRWGDNPSSFIRPVRNALAMLDSTHIAFSAFGVESSSHTIIRQNEKNIIIPVKNPQHYFESMRENHIMLSQTERKERILRQIGDIEKKHNIKVELDSELLEEVVAITETPNAIYGEFATDFLVMPKEIIITSMKDNQRYFATYKAYDLDSLNNGFVMVSNAKTSDFSLIIKGNQKVLKARLSDALFFYINDIKNGFKDAAIERGLSNITFVNNLGTLADKYKREQKIAQKLLEMSALSCDAKELDSALFYARADLLSEVVYEFPELQGIMGFYYAKAFGKSKEFATSIKEQYMPKGEKDSLPQSILGSLLSLSVKFDSIFVLFSIDKIPTGSKDPFGLRRAASGIIRILHNLNMPFSLDSNLETLFYCGGYKNCDLNAIKSFFIERMEHILGVNPSILRCVIGGGNLDICHLMNMSKALNEFIEKSDKNALRSLFKRLANILDKLDLNQEVLIDESLLQKQAEKNLYTQYKETLNKQYANNYELISNLFMLNGVLEEFFNEVLVNDENVSLANNRKMLILGIYQLFLQIGDIKHISL